VRSLAARAIALRRFDSGRVEAPAEYAKRRHLLALFHEHGHRVFVESGTYRGDTTAFFLRYAERLLTVEVDPRLFQRARARFAHAPKVQVIEGDALVEIPRVVGELTEPPLIWLDGHYSGGETGKGAEVEPALEIIRRLGGVAPAGSTIVVDDLRLFGLLPDFPRLDDLIIETRAAFPTATVRAGLDSLVVLA
jgi:hypothetical protein